MLPLLIALWTGDVPAKPRKRWWRGFRLGYIAGLAFFIPNLAWVRHSSRVIGGARGDEWMGWPVELMGWAAVLALSGFIALYFALWGGFAVTIGRPRIVEIANQKMEASKIAGGALFSFSLESLRSAFLCAAMWAGMEWLRGIVLTGFPWNGLGVPLASQLAMIQSADIVGANGLSFLPVFCSCIAYNTVLRFREEARTSRVRPHLDFFCAVGLVLLNFIYGFRILSGPQPKGTIPLRVLLVQLNMGQVERWSGRHTDDIYRSLESLTQPLAKVNNSDLVVWPESSLPAALHHEYNMGFFDGLLADAQYSLLTGVDIIRPGEPNYTGAALFYRGFEGLQIYRKTQLVPFGEYLPMRWFPLMETLLGGVLPGDFASGTVTEPFFLPQRKDVQLVPLICFEDTFGRVARRFVRTAPQLLVNCTNDGWFLHSAENEQHLANPIFRCVELRRPMVRAANTGITCIVGSDGRITRRLEDAKTHSPFIRGTLAGEVDLERTPPMTFYARFGDTFSITMLLIATASTVAGFLRSRKTATALALKAQE
jgi:apolipoprotein N-acyltransferase